MVLWRKPDEEGSMMELVCAVGASCGCELCLRWTWGIVRTEGDIATQLRDVVPSAKIGICMQQDSWLLLCATWWMCDVVEERF
jgi:hypothetical protein